LIGGITVAYSKARAEREWLTWKEAEEKKLRELGVDEDTIQRLHTYDWAQFQSDRRFLERWEEWPPYVEWGSAGDIELPVTDTESLLDSIENVELLHFLSTENKLTIQIVFLKMQGFSTEEICQQLGITLYSCYNRIKRFKQKLKKFFESD